MNFEKYSPGIITVFLLIVFLFQGCTVGPDFTPPQIKTPDTFRSTLRRCKDHK